jgi:L-fuculose-phosphate aldolase
MANPWKLKQEMCEIGRRMVARGLVSAFEGNLSARAGPDRLLCTPSGMCKGQLKPEDLCFVDLNGKQFGGGAETFGPRPARQRSSEILLHVAIYRERPDVQAVVHTHAPHATAFAITHTPVPSCVSPEVEVYLGRVPLAPYATPGTPEVGESVAPLVRDANVILLANHGTVSCGKTLEEALFRTEILESYCRLLLIARPLGPVQRLSDSNMRDLMTLKQKLGIPDSRATQETFQDCDLCGNNVVGRGFCGEGDSLPVVASSPVAQHPVPSPSTAITAPDAAAGAVGDLDSMVREIADRVLKRLEGQ